ncbi:hypothetical protein CYLTODRAFT_460393 [Cylindrobasidium torrendii FP15055 ss-10]|uniref:Uncharacterized protein n=1 Tax=Cylindrobasidium torrendii FP15055 ss-10 TaxID=1314674 RepID=A0A0D7AS30_9AGAR|nr:hypothetical protein CYLTODRAFT_460393 [Cylindrobasidium torrendii FP15055 ss-10]
MGSPWNRALQKTICDGIFGSTETHLPRNADKTIVRRAIKVHLKYIMLKDNDYPGQLAPRIKARCNQYGRAYYTLHRRRKALAYFCKDETVQRALDIFDDFDSSAMSDDEPDADDPHRFVVQIPAWRNPAPVVTQFFTLPDYLALSLGFEINGDWSRLPGQIARLRLDKGIINTKATPPIGLARNLYDPLWLAGLSEYNLARLELKPDIDLNQLQYSENIHR